MTPQEARTLREAIAATRRELGLDDNAPVDKRAVLQRHPPVQDLARFIRHLLNEDVPPPPATRFR